jgi:hypothetical protein
MVCQVGRVQIEDIRERPRLVLIFWCAKSKLLERAASYSGLCDFDSAVRRRKELASICDKRFVGFIMVPDPRWLEILKASGWQTAAVAAACGFFLLIAHWGWLPPLEAWMIHLAAIALLICGFLAVASIISAASKIFPVQVWLLHRLNSYRAKRAVRDYIPHMTERERTIIGYLLAKNQKMLTAASDGGYATTLISRGIICLALKPGQRADMFDVPMMVPDDVWNVLIENKDQFPYSFTPKNRGDVERHPWRRPSV